MTKVLSVAHLREMVQGGQHDFFVSLAGGLARSSKNIDCDDENFYVFNEIDGTEDQYSDEEFAESFIGEAITKGALYSY